jgi:hypothetical protein
LNELKSVKKAKEPSLQERDFSFWLVKIEKFEYTGKEKNG